MPLFTRSSMKNNSARSLLIWLYLKNKNIVFFLHVFLKKSLNFFLDFTSLESLEFYMSLDSNPGWNCEVYIISTEIELFIKTNSNLNTNKNNKFINNNPIMKCIFFFEYFVNRRAWLGLKMAAGWLVCLLVVVMAYISCRPPSQPHPYLYIPKKQEVVPTLKPKPEAISKNYPTHPPLLS